MIWVQLICVQLWITTGQNFKKVLAEASLTPIDTQKDFLYQRFTEWKGDYRQIDDVLVMGIKF